MREVDGLKVGFVSSEVYFEGFHTPSMGSTARATGADVVFLLAPGKTGDDISDEMVREMLALAKPDAEPANDSLSREPERSSGDSA